MSSYPSALIAANIAHREGDTNGVDLGDGGGVMTFAGQTEAWLSRWGLPKPTDDASAQANIQQWLALSGLVQIVNRDTAVGDACADFAYDSGEVPAIRALQTALGGVTVDGLLGAFTLAALVKCADYPALTRAVGKLRVQFLATAAGRGEIVPSLLAGVISRALTFV